MQGSLGKRAGGALVVAALALVVPVAALAAPAKAPAAGKKDKGAGELAKLDAELRSGEPERVAAALAPLTERPAAWVKAAPIVEQWLAEGAPVAQVRLGIAALGALRQPSSSGVLARYARFRQLVVREEAVTALGKTGGSVAAEALRLALRSKDDTVRRRAATALGEAGVVEAAPELLLALDRGVEEAAPSLGLLCAAETCPQLVERVGKLPFPTVSRGLEALFGRSAAPAAPAVLLQAVSAVVELKTQAAKALLERLLEVFPKAGDAKVRAALTQGVAALGGEQGS